MSLKIRNYVSYGIGDLFGGGAFTLLGTFFMVFLTNHVGMSPWLAGLIFGLGRVFLGVIDPIIGNLSDNIRTRFGRRRVFFFTGFLFFPIMLTFIPLWMIPMKVLPDHSNEMTVFFYYLVMYCLFDIVYCVLETPYAALASDMSYEYKDRVFLSAARMACSQFSSFLSTLFAPMILIAYAYSSYAYFLMATIFSVFYSVIWLIVFLGTKEIPVSYAKKKKKQITKSARDFIVGLLSTLKNKTFRVHLILYLCAFSSLDFIMTFSTYYFSVYLNNANLIQWIFVLWITQLIILPIYIYIARQKSMAIAYRIGACIWVLSMLFLITLTPNSHSDAHIIGTFILMGIGLSPCYVMPMMMLSFVTEIDVLLNGQRRTGVYAGAMSFFRKASQGLIILPGIGMILTLSNYNPELSMQSPTTVNAVYWIYICIPIILITIGFFASFRFYINRINYPYISKEVAKLESGDTSHCSCQITKELCEKTTNKTYEELIYTWKHKHIDKYIKK